MSTEPQPTTASNMTHAKVLQALIGLMAAFFVLLLSGTVVATSLPVIIPELGGTQSDYTWVVTANFLAMAISTPIWGKLADIFEKKLLIQLNLVIFVVATVVAGFAPSAIDGDPQGGAMWLIICRLFQGIGVGGLMALGMVAIADIVSPRERGKYMGIMGAVMGVAQIGGPLLGGVITDAIGWRWNFFLPVPVAIVAFILIQATLQLPRIKRYVKIDYLGAVLLAAGVGTVLVWISLAGAGEFEWGSGVSVTMAIIGGILVIAAIFWELFGTTEPIVPLRLFAQRTFALATVASIAVGVTMFGATVFLSQYLQLARGLTPTESGLYTIPMVIGSLLASVALGQLISRTGVWKPFVIGSAVVLVVGLALMGTIHYDTSMWLVGLYMAMLGLGTGGLMQNLVLVTQNQLPPTLMGAGTGAVTFFRSLGGTVGIAILGASLGSMVAEKIKAGVSELAAGLQATPPVVPEGFADPQQGCAELLQGLQAGGNAVPDVAKMTCEPVKTIFESGYADSIATLFWYCVPLAVISLIAVLFIPNKPLSRKTAAQQLEEELGAEFTALEPEDA